MNTDYLVNSDVEEPLSPQERKRKYNRQHRRNIRLRIKRGLRLSDGVFDEDIVGELPANPKLVKDKLE